jgi:hypothetical protein
MKIKVGKFDVYESGSIVGNEDESIDFILIEKDNFFIRFTFINNSNKKEHCVNANALGENSMEIVFTNYNNSLGIGNSEPIKIGRLNNRELYLNYRIYCLTKGAKHVHYTWLLGEEVQSGK